MNDHESTGGTTLVVGATGATGRLLVRELLRRGRSVRAVVRSADRLPADVRDHARLDVIEASLLDLPDDALAAHVRGCGSVASCLGHNMSLRGLFGPPRRLVTDAVRRLCEAVRADAGGGAVRFVLMNTAGNVDPDHDEPVSRGEGAAIAVLRRIVPPHADNEAAAEYLRTHVGADDARIGWAVVRPDTLHDADAASGYTAHGSPTRSALFDPGRTSRANVARFMASLVTDDDAWARWRGRMPVIYDAE